ncbi:MAG TPA: bacterial transcriptional activator domain-containing protein [Acidimicrobiales bacterium]|nr:bacterial transcriptional activator domain-containing protein [Acidimicrobiales bacterium]
MAFTDALRRGDTAAAVRHYGGDFLPACYDDWVTAEGQRLRSLSIDALTRLAVEANEEGRDNEAVGHARDLLRVDDLHEPAYRVLMEALARRGDRSEALRTYHRCINTLERELGVGPEAATVEAYNRLRSVSAAHEATGQASIDMPRLMA